MYIVCAWCGKDMGEKDGEGIEGISHSMCEECLSKFAGESGEQEYHGGYRESK